jgi:hypothetical protein
MGPTGGNHRAQASALTISKPDFIRRIHVARTLHVRAGAALPHTFISIPKTMIDPDRILRYATPASTREAPS